MNLHDVGQKCAQMGMTDSVISAINRVRLHALKDVVGYLAMDSHRVAIDHGFDYNNKSQQYALFHSEVSEAFETLRNPGEPSEKIAGFTNEEEELADVVLRILGYSHAHGLRTIEAMFHKNEYNRQRPYKHGGKKF